MGRIQQGYIYESSGAFFVRYYITEIVDGNPVRVQRSHRLCEKSEKYYARNAKSVKLLRNDFMQKVNTQQASGRSTQQDMTVLNFWEQRYLPAYVLQQRDAEHAVEGMDTNLLVRPVIHRSPAQPVAVLESLKDLLDMLLPAISSDHLFCSPIAMVGH